MSGKSKVVNAALRKDPSPGGVGSATEQDMAEINKFALVPLTADQVYIRKMYLANNCIDRDGERFDEDVLDDFATTAPGKGFLNAHRKQDMEDSLGLIFNAQTVEMPLAESEALVGEPLKLPPGKDKVKWLVCRFYIPLLDEDDRKLAQKINAGVLRFVSIGFSCGSSLPVYDEVSGDLLYYELRSPGETREGSLVWLGAQSGAQIKAAGDKNGQPSYEKKEIPPMKGLLKALGLSEAADEASAIKVVQQKFEQSEGSQKVLDALGVKTVNEAKALRDQAEMGKAYRKTLEEEMVVNAQKAGLCDAPEAKAAMEKHAQAAPFPMLMSESAHYKALAHSKNPAAPKTAHGGQSDATQGKSFVSIVEEIKQAEKISFSDAAVKAASLHPDLYAAHVKASSTAPSFN